MMQRIIDLALRAAVFTCGVVVAGGGILVLSLEVEIQHVIPAVACIILGIYMCILPLTER